MGTINYHSISVKEFIDACNEVESLIREKEKMTANHDATNTTLKTNYSAELRDKITAEANSIVKRRKIIKIILLLLSFCAIDYICDQIGAVSDIVYGTGYIICIIIFLISWFKKIGTDFNKIIDQLNRKYSSVLHSCQELDQENLQKAEITKKYNDAQLQILSDKLEHHKALYDCIISFATDLGNYNEWELNMSNYVNRLLTPLRLQLMCLKPDMIIDADALLIERCNEEWCKISNHTSGYHTSLY